MATVVRSELNGLRHAKGFQPFRGRSEERPAAADGIGHLTHDAGDWSVFYLLAGGVDCSSQQGLCPKTTRILVHAPPPRHRARTRCPHLTWFGVSMRSGPDTKTGSSVVTRLEVAPAPPLLCSAAAQRRPCCGIGGSAGCRASAPRPSSRCSRRARTSARTAAPATSGCGCTWGCACRMARAAASAAPTRRARGARARCSCWCADA